MRELRLVLLTNGGWTKPGGGDTGCRWASRVPLKGGKGPGARAGGDRRRRRREERGAQSSLGRELSRPWFGIGGRGEVGEGREDSRRLLDVHSVGKRREKIWLPWTCHLSRLLNLVVLFVSLLHIGHRILKGRRVAAFPQRKVLNLVIRMQGGWMNG